MSLVRFAQQSILNQSVALNNMAELLDDSFDKAVQMVVDTTGRVVVTGIGKSAIIAQKIVATFNSTGTPAIFMHAADAIHGDLGMIQKNDVVICISKSGNTPEIKVLVPFIKRAGNPIIALTGVSNSYLGSEATVTLNTYVANEVCPNNLAPTTSTTAQLVMGDALAVTLMHVKGFSQQDFAQYHPGGMLGRQLTARVKDFVKPMKDICHVNQQSDLKEVIMAISSGRLGATIVFDEAKNPVGIITDGDIRRMLTQHDEIKSVKATDIMSINPKRINAESYIAEAINLMKTSQISHLVVFEQSAYLGMIQLQDLIKEGF